MGSPGQRFTLVLTLVAGLLAATLAPVTAQQGHNPFAATPGADGIANGSGWEVAEVTPLEIDGAAVAIAPDGTAIAGVGLDREFCVWSVPDLEPTCVGGDLSIDPDSIAWAPDSSAVAFSVLAFQYLIDGDIYVFELADGTIHNATDDGIEEVNLLATDGPPVPMDVVPAWTPDSQALVFSRTVYDDRDELSNEIMRVPRAGGDPETLLSLDGMPGSIWLPMHVLEDGSVLYTVGFSDIGEPTNGLWQLSPDGDPAQLMAGDGSAAFPVPMINSVWEGDGELRIVGHSPFVANQMDIPTPFTFTWSSATGEAVPLKPVVDPELTVVYPGPFSPDGETLLTLDRPAGQDPLVSIQGPATSTAELPESSSEIGPGRPRYMSPTWSSTNLVLVPPVFTNGAYLLTMEPASGTSSDLEPSTPCSCAPPTGPG